MKTTLNEIRKHEPKADDCILSNDDFHEGDYIDVYKLTMLTGQICFYGVESTAKAAARGTGTVELVRIPRREFALVAQAVNPAPAPAPAEPITPKQALEVISAAMREDPDYAWSWHCNVAMAAQDAGAPHKEANERAAQFMRNAFGIDTRVNSTAHPAPVPASQPLPKNAQCPMCKGIAAEGDHLKKLNDEKADAIEIAARRIVELEAQLAEAVKERNEWAAKWKEMRRKYGELRYPGMGERVIKAMELTDAQDVIAYGCTKPPMIADDGKRCEHWCGDSKCPILWREKVKP